MPRRRGEYLGLPRPHPADAASDPLPFSLSSLGLTGNVTAHNAETLWNVIWSMEGTPETRRACDRALGWGEAAAGVELGVAGAIHMENGEQAEG